MAFIVFEGVDGSGKSTLIRELVSLLDQRSISYLVTREPGGTTLAEEIRQLIIRVDDEVPHPRTELLLYEAARAQHVEYKIKPALREGKWVICDRYTASSLAFQAGGRHIEEVQVQWLNDFATDQLVPDFWVLLDLPVKQALQRQMQRYQGEQEKQDRFEREKADFHQNVREHFLKQAGLDTSKWIVLDAQQSPKQLADQLVNALREKNCLI